IAAGEEARPPRALEGSSSAMALSGDGGVATATSGVEVGSRRRWRQRGQRGQNPQAASRRSRSGFGG
ncbi:hypothetical protein Dimus_026194, partial [Dionaea muscipula]